MSADAFILDAYSERDRIVVWLRSAKPDGTAVRISEPFTPSFFVRASPTRLAKLADDVATLPWVGTPRRVSRLCALEEHPSDVLEVPVTRHDRLHPTAHAVDLWGEFRENELYDVDLRMSHRYFLSKGIFPCAKVRTFAQGRYYLLDDQWDIDYPSPPFRTVLLSAKTPDGRPPLRPGEPVAEVTLDDETFDGSEETILSRLSEEIRTRDPDVVFTHGGDGILLQHLLERARRAGLRDWGLGRDGSPPVVLRKGRSYFSYGKIYYRPSPVAIRGRVHVDLDAATLCPEGGLDALVEQSRIASTPLPEIARLTAGTAFSTMQVDVAKREGRIIPYRKNHPETPKNGHTYLLADRGALTFDPRCGVWDDCFELDFGSFFPRLMIHRNLSPETVLCGCCDPNDPAHPPELFVPRVGYHVCKRRAGINGKTLRRLVDRRDEYKRRRKTRPEELEKWQVRNDLLKMELVCSFGYQGHKNHRHGRIEVHESINAWARHDLVRTTAIARDCGFDVLHGLSDSLWLNRLRPGADAEEVARRVGEEVGVPFDLQGRFKWLVLLPNKTSRAPGSEPVGALTRFYGCFDSDVLPTRSNGSQKYDYVAGGRMKVRGVELRQHSTPGIVRRVQEVVLERLALADNTAELAAAVPAALAEAAPVLAEIRRGEVPLSDLVVVNSVSRELSEFKVETNAWAAVAALAEVGIRVPPGESVAYVVLDEDADSPRRRVAETRALAGGEGYDPRFYLRLAHRAIASLLLPFGYTEERVAEWYGGRRPTTLASFGLTRRVARRASPPFPAPSRGGV